jgi:hypothetical protein
LSRSAMRTKKTVSTRWWASLPSPCSSVEEKGQSTWCSLRGVSAMGTPLA